MKRAFADALVAQSGFYWKPTPMKVAPAAPARACGAKHFICDSAEYWNEADPKQWACTECGNQECNLGVGFSLYEEEDQRRDVRWISVGNRCTKCGTLGSFVDWKIGYGPSDQLLNQA
jgi:hypothetical protein